MCIRDSDSLIRRSATEHLRLLDQAGARQRLRDSGWIFLFLSLIHI